MNHKLLSFAFTIVVLLAIYSCKKNTNMSPAPPVVTPPTIEQLQQQTQDSINNASFAEKTRAVYFKPYLTSSNTLNGIALKGNIKTLLVVDSIGEERNYQTYNQAGYLTLDSLYSFNTGTLLIRSFTKVVYDNNNLATMRIRKNFSNSGTVPYQGDSILYTIKDSETAVVEDWSWDGTQWSFPDKHAFTYASKGKIASDTSFSYNYTTKTWTANLVTVNEYNTDGNRITSTQNTITAAISPATKIIYTYDAQGNPISIRYLSYKEVSNLWETDNVVYSTITYW